MLVRDPWGVAVVITYSAPSGSREPMHREARFWRARGRSVRGATGCAPQLDRRFVPRDRASVGLWRAFPAWLVVATILGAIGCAPRGGSVSDEERAEIERSVLQRVEAFAEAERRRDVEAILDFLAPDFYMYADGTRVDRETVEAQIRATMPALQRFETTWSDVEVTVLAHDHALVSLVFRDAITDGDGVTSRLRGSTTFVLRLREGAWSILYADADHYGESVP